MATFPNERHGADSTILALNGETDPATGLAYIARGTNANSTPSYEVQYNRRLLRQNLILAVVRQGMVTDESPSTVGVYPIEYSMGGERKSFDGATGVAVPEDTTSAVYIDSGNQLVVSDQFPVDASTFLPLATIVNVGGSMTITDERSAVIFSVS